MKKNVFSKITGLVLAVAALMCFSCRQNLDFNVIDKAAESVKTKVKIGTEMRTALPVNTTAALTDIVFSGKLHGSDAEAENYRTWADYAALADDTTPIEFDAANYDLTLTAKAGAFTYKGVLDDFEIAGATMRISFPMKLFSLDASLLDDSETGSFEVKLYFTNRSSRNVTSAKAWLYKVETAEENGETVESEVIVEGWDGKAITLTDGSSSEPDGISSSYKIADTIGTDLPAGHYVVMWELYTGSDSLKLIDKDPTREDIYIDGGKNSKSLKKLESIERNYTITFNLNGGSWATGFAAPTHYTRLTKPEFPSDSDVADRTGYAFGGWYAGSDFSGSPVTSIADSEVSDKTYYAKWIPNTYSITYNNMEDAEFRYVADPYHFVYDTELILPRPSKAGYNFRGWFADAECTLGLNNRIARIKAKSRTEDVTLYAKWEPVEQVRMVYAKLGEVLDETTGEITGVAQNDLTHLCMEFIGHYSGTTDVTYRGQANSDTQKEVTAFRTHYPNTKLLGSYAGGDDGSDVCSELIVDPANRKKIIENIVKFVATYNLDGIDLDWEYFSSYSTYNPVYATFTTELRAALDENFKDYILLTIAVQKGSSFYTDSRIKEMLCKFDFIGLMSYDCGSSLRGTYEKQTKVNGVYQYKMGTSKVPHISFNGRHKPGTYVSGGNTDSDNDISSVIDSYAAITGADKLVAGIGYYGHAYYILPEGVQIAFAEPKDSNKKSTDKHYSKGVRSGDETAYFATVADIADDKIVEGLITVHPTQGSTYTVEDWGCSSDWSYEEYRIAAGYTYDYAKWKKFAKEQGTDKEKTVTTGHFASQDGFVAYEYFETDVDYTYTDGEGNPQTCKLYALYVFDDATAISGKVAEYVSSTGKGCAGAMAWVLQGDDSAHDLNNALVAAVKDNCAYAAATWKYAEHESTIVIESVPDDAMRNYTSSAAEPTGGWKIYGVDDLVKLASVVTGGNSLSGVTITVARDITINESVLSSNFLEPAEGATPGTPNPNLVNLDSIGMRGKPFCGTFDGNNKIISGLYMYQAHQGLALIGEAGDGAVIKNVILRDACVIPMNIWEGLDDEGNPSHDGSDDDRFGLLVGCSEYSSGTILIDNCIVEGVVGSNASQNRTGATASGGCEYGAGILGEVGKKNGTLSVTISNCIVLARNYTGSDKLIVNKERVTASQSSNTGYRADTQLADGKAAIDAAVTAARGE